MTIHEISELQGMLGVFIAHLDDAIDHAAYESPLYWSLVDRRSAAVAAYEATIGSPIMGRRDDGMITRHKVTTADGARFYFADEAKARAFAAKTGGAYHGVVTFDSIAQFMSQHQ